MPDIISNLPADTRLATSAAVAGLPVGTRENPDATAASTPTKRPAAVADAPPEPRVATSPTDPGEGGEGGKGAAAAPPLPPSAAPASEGAPGASPGSSAGSASAPSASTKAAPRPVSPWSGDDLYRPAPGENPVLAALRRDGLYLEQAGDRQHRIVSPFAAKPGADRVEAWYFEPSAEVPLGRYYCPHPSETAHGIGAFLDKIGVERDIARCKPRIRVKNGELHRVVWVAEQVLFERGGFYVANGVVATIKSDAKTGDITIEPVGEQALTMHLSELCDWQKFDGRSEAWKRCDVPINVVKALLNAQTLKLLPKLDRLTRQPFLRRPDTALRMMPGYDASCGVYAAFDEAAFYIPPPTRDHAEQALARLDSLLSEFEFASPSDRATALSAMLTATIRDYLKLAPAFNITASSPGSGKSYLASVIAPFAGPGQSRNISYPTTNEEATKVVLSLAMEQPAVVLFDDMPTDWLPHGAMNRMLTNGSITERLLGSSRVVTAHTSSFVMGTGNNIRPIRDMARRVASIYILPQREVAATRDFTGDPAEEVRRNRGRYVSDALTIITAWRASHCPRANVPNLAGFEEWSDLCRHSLIWLGMPDPATSLIEQLTHDPDTEVLGDLLYAWKDTFGERPTLVRQVLAKIDNDRGGRNTATCATPSWNCPASSADTSTSRGSGDTLAATRTGS